MNILFIRYKKAPEILEGGEQASQKNFNVLCKIVGNTNVTTYYIHDESKKRTLIDYLKGILYFPFGYYFGLTPTRVKEIVKLSSQYDVIWIDRSIFGIIAKKLKEKRYKGSTIGFFHNVETMYFEAKISQNLPFRKIIINCANRNDKYTCHYCDKIVVLNQRDQKKIQELYGRKADQIAPIAFFDKYNRDTYPSEFTQKQPVCTFLGSYFPANNEGIEWFVKNVFPYVSIQMRIVGKGMNKIKNEPWMLPEIEVLANVPDLLPIFEESDLMVFPIFKGGGMKVKTCESLMYGKNIIGTDEAWEGYNLDYEKAGARCNTADEFINAISNYQQHPKPRFNQYSRQKFLQDYSETNAIKIYKEVLD